MLGPLIAAGRTSRVFRSGNDAVAKVLNPGVPEHWAAVEASLTTAVRALGAPAPEVLDVVTVDGGPAILFRYVAGPSMWQQMVSKPRDVDALMRDAVEMQRSVHALGVPDGLPGNVERMCRKIAEVDVVPDEERRIAVDMASSLPRGAALLHGDFHPGNILVCPSGLVVIDWFDASVGHPVADIARTELLIGADCVSDRRHLPGAGDDDLRTISAVYASAVADVVEHHAERLDRWRAVTALSRLAEHTDDDIDVLVARWNEHRARSNAAIHV